MRALIQRVRHASVQIDSEIVGEIGRGLVILLGVEHDDDLSDVAWLSGKVAGMRIFSDAAGKMNASVTDVGGSALIVSQFTLHASTKKGNRPSFIRAARPEHATPLYEAFVAALGEHVPVATGRFGAMMDVALVNEGPVTIWIDSRNRE